ncbi:50S ribosomal protein L21 [Candidatus Poribacteria bacterium]|jgi:large subunit ribosomal protein L21|nr:50S ribosomal protein L21 [Candidatus Poribacteria bacterium]MDE0686530.1 50S ribosomal protein L21 [Candidatus Poribacteria bacterium]MXV82565.1 50S ribosomal protein L21 [Candidatus Poribacteria bacterium]MYA55686.1 50S ribosomal protein L21 [Candidatus Poribacteria bacterium]
MYAVFASGGKQHRVEVGSLIDVEKLDAAVGDSVTFSSVLAVADDEGQLQAGSPYLDNTSVTAEVVQQARGKKMVVFKSKRRKGYKRKLGHRQSFTRVKITAIGAVEEQSDGS